MSRALTRPGPPTCRSPVLYGLVGFKIDDLDAPRSSQGHARPFQPGSPRGRAGPDKPAIVPTGCIACKRADCDVPMARTSARSGASHAPHRRRQTRAPRTSGSTARNAATPRPWNMICWRSFMPVGFFMIFLWRYNSMAFAPTDSRGGRVKCISLTMHPPTRCSFKVRARGHERGGHDHAGCIY